MTPSNALFIHALRLRHFRNCAELDLEFSPHVNLILGANAQGKTTLLEAIFLSVLGRSFRTSQMSELVQTSKETFFTESRFYKSEVEHRIRIRYGPSERSFFFNATKCASAGALLGLLPGVVLTSEDIGLIRGSPQQRRHFLDLQIAQTDPLYLHYLTRYQRAMRQRNHLLRARSSQTVAAWETEMAQAGSYLVKERSKAVQKLLVSARKRYHHLTDNKETLELAYKSSAPLASSLEEIRLFYLETYQKERPREMQMGMTLHGPHRDDLGFTIEGRDARLFSSEGQQRSAVIALRLAEYDRIAHVSGHQPLIAIDDVAISLDEERTRHLFEEIQALGQVFLTSAGDLSRFSFPAGTARFTLKEGCLLR